jgi:predicted nuclease of predicted toxin-antitoxin system
VRFLVDAQLPHRVVDWLAAAGCDAVHTLDLPNGNRTTDQRVIDFADREKRAVVTKDADFVDSHILQARPARLLLISTGNIGNRELEALMIPLLPAIVHEFQSQVLSHLAGGESPFAGK